MVRVAVEHGDAARLALPLEPSARAAELDDHASASARGDAGELERRERGGGVAAVVLAGHSELELHRLELLGAHDVRHLAQPLLEERLHLGARAERRVVVEVDVEEHGDLRPERGDRAVRLVALDDEPALARARVAAELRDLAADQERRVEPEPVEAERDHRARRRLAVRAGDDDRAAQRDELGEQVGARPALDAARERGRDVDLPARRRRRRLGRDLDGDALEMPQVRRLDAIPAGDLGAPRVREERVRAHAGAADPGDPDAPTGERLRGRRAHRRSRPLRRAWRRRASRRPSPRDGRGRRAAPRRAAARAPPPPRARRPRRRRRRSTARSSPGGAPVAYASGTSTAGSPAAASSQTEPPARASDDVGGAVRDADLVDERQQEVVGARDAALQLGVVALAAEVEDGGPGVGPGVERDLVQQARAEGAAEDEHDAARRGAGRAGCAPPRGDAVATPPGSAGRRAVLLPVPAERKREEDALGERRGEPVREAEMRVGLGQRARDPAQPRGEHHRPGDVAAAAEHDVGLRRRRMRRHATGAASACPARARAQARAGAGARRPRTRRTRSRAQERAAPRRDPATRRTSPARPAAAALPPLRVTARRVRPSRRPRSGTAAAARPP